MSLGVLLIPVMRQIKYLDTDIGEWLEDIKHGGI